MHQHALIRQLQHDAEGRQVGGGRWHSVGPKRYVADHQRLHSPPVTLPKRTAQPSRAPLLTGIAVDYVYLVCEPPGEPYYIGRIMEFLRVGNNPANPVDAVRINWLYRPKDIGRRVQDTRLLFATMHSDISPLAALRGKCEIRHRSEIDNLDEYRKTPDCFWYEKLYDRYIQKNYDLIPTSAIINVPEKVKRVLDERWKFVLVEQGRGKELTSAMKLCKKCGAYCARFVSILFCSPVPPFRALDGVPLRSQVQGT